MNYEGSRVSDIYIYIYIWGCWEQNLLQIAIVACIIVGDHVTEG